MNDAWRIKFGAGKPSLESSIQCWRAEDAPGLGLQFSCAGQATTWRILWRRLDDDKYDDKKSCNLRLNPSGKMHTYHIDLASSSEYRSLITGLAIQPISQPRPGEAITIKSIALTSGKRIEPGQPRFKY